MDEKTKEMLLQNMTQNLPTLRCCLGVSQVKLAEMIGVGRCTITSIENNRRPMTWNLFLSLILIFTKNKKTDKLLVPMGIYTDELNDLIKLRNEE